MLNKIWPMFLIVSIIYAIFSGNVENLSNGIFSYAGKAVELSITFLGTMCLWTGIIEIIKNTSLINKLKKLLKPIMKILFPNIKKEDKEYDEISMNIVANLLGIGNAATPLGIKAMQTMQEKNKEKNKLTDSMVLLIVLNTASIQIIPTTVIAIRNSLGSQNPTKIIIPVWIATICAAVSGITLTKLLLKINRR